MNTRIEIGGLWIEETKNGRKQLCGKFGHRTRMVVIKNGFKTSEDSPDYIMYLEKPGEKDDNH